MRHLKHKSATTIQAGEEQTAHGRSFFLLGVSNARVMRARAMRVRESGGEAVSILVVPLDHLLRSGLFKPPAVSTFARDFDELTTKKRSVDRLNEWILWCI